MRKKICVEIDGEKYFSQARSLDEAWRLLFLSITSEKKTSITTTTKKELKAPLNSDYFLMNTPSERNSAIKYLLQLVANLKI